MDCLTWCNKVGMWLNKQLGVILSLCLLKQPSAELQFELRRLQINYAPNVLSFLSGCFCFVLLLLAKEKTRN